MTTTSEEGKRKVGRPEAVDANDWTKQTFVVRKDFLDKLKCIAYWERRTTKTILDMALEAFLEGKEIRPIPGEEDESGS